MSNPILHHLQSTYQRGYPDPDSDPPRARAMRPTIVQRIYLVVAFLSAGSVTFTALVIAQRMIGYAWGTFHPPI
jgi:hypothetical protein